MKATFPSFNDHSRSHLKFERWSIFSHGRVKDMTISKHTLWKKVKENLRGWSIVAESFIQKNGENLGYENALLLKKLGNDI